MRSRTHQVQAGPLERSDRLEHRGIRGSRLLIAIGSGALLLTFLMPLLLGRRLVRYYELERAERRRAEAAEARNAATLETALDGIITIDHTGMVLEFNKAAEAIFGYRRGEVIGRELATLIIPPPLRELHRQGLAEYLFGEGHVLVPIEVPAPGVPPARDLVELSITPPEKQCPSYGFPPGHHGEASGRVRARPSPRCREGGACRG